MFGDVVGYRPGASEPERVKAVCLARQCSFGFGRTFGSGSFSLDSVNIEVRPDRNGVREVVERGSSDRFDVTAFGGWMKRSFFASRVNPVKDDENPNRGATVMYSYVLGSGTGENPTVIAGTASRAGFAVGRDADTAGDPDSVVKGDASISVRLERSNLRAAVQFTGLANTETGTRYPDMAWRGMTV